MKKTTVALSLLSLMLALPSQAQTARKPSSFEAGQKEAATKIKTQTAALHKLSSKRDFDQMARVYEQDTDYEIPHVIFLIDLKETNASITSTPPNTVCTRLIWRRPKVLSPMMHN